MKEYYLAGEKFETLSDFFSEFASMIHGKGKTSEKFGEAGYFGRSIQAFDDCLFGGFGLESPCEIIWGKSNISKINLNHEVYSKWCRSQIEAKEYLDEEGLEFLISEEAKAKKSEGITMFDFLVDLISTVDKRSKGQVKVKLTLK